MGISARARPVSECLVSFESFFEYAEPRLRRALVAALGSERGVEASAEALAFGWERWDRVRVMENPLGYLFRVGQSRARRRRSRALYARPEHPDLWIEPKLPAALATLSKRQRLAVVLVHGFGWQLREVADLTGLKEPVRIAV